MFGMRHGSECEGRWAAGRGWRRRHGFGGGGRHGMGGGDMIRAGRMLATGDLRLIALALIAEQPRHGYEIIKVLEEKTSGWYSPSPGIVYPPRPTAPRSSTRSPPRAAPISSRIAISSIRCSSVSPRSAKRSRACAGVWAARIGMTATDFPRSCRPRSRICARSPQNASKATKMRRQSSSRSWRAPRRSCARREDEQAGCRQVRPDGSERVSPDINPP